MIILVGPEIHLAEDRGERGHLHPPQKSYVPPP